MKLSDVHVISVDFYHCRYISDKTKMEFVADIRLIKDYIEN